MTEEAHRPWLEIPIPNYLPVHNPEEWSEPYTRGDKEYEENPEEERRVIIIDL